jgi:hypothetical protein
MVTGVLRFSHCSKNNQLFFNSKSNLKRMEVFLIIIQIAFERFARDHSPSECFHSGFNLKNWKQNLSTKA